MILVNLFDNKWFKAKNFNEINKNAFDRFFLKGSPNSNFFVKETKWWVSPKEILLLFVGKDLTDNDWMGGIIAPDENGDHRAIETFSSIETESEVEEIVLRRAEEIFQSGKVIHFQNTEDKSPLLIPNIENALSITIHDQGDNDEIIAEVLAELSIIYRTMNGSGINFEASGVEIDDLLEA